MAIGIEIPTNFPFYSAGPVSLTKLPSRTPIIIVSRIQTAKKWSSTPSNLKAETFLGELSSSNSYTSYFSISYRGISYTIIARVGILLPIRAFSLLSRRSVLIVILDSRFS